MFVAVGEGEEDPVGMLLKEATEVPGDTAAQVTEDKEVELLGAEHTGFEVLVFSTVDGGGDCVVPGRLAEHDGECDGRHDLWKYLLQKEQGVGTDFCEKTLSHFEHDLLPFISLSLRTSASISSLKALMSTCLMLDNSSNLDLIKTFRNQTGALLRSGIRALPCIWTSRLV